MENLVELFAWQLETLTPDQVELRRLHSLLQSRGIKPHVGSVEDRAARAAARRSDFPFHYFEDGTLIRFIPQFDPYAELNSEERQERKEQDARNEAYRNMF